MNSSQVTSAPLSKLNLWQKLEDRCAPLSFDFEITARCNNNCRHCYINLPAKDPAAIERELSLAQIKVVIDEAVSLGVLWCLLTGGEPLLRKDFSEIYLYLKKKGVLVSVFTNATLVNNAHIRLFRKYPPRDIEVSVYGVTAKTYEQVTRIPGSFSAFMRGLELLSDSGVNIRLKAMALRSNLSEFKQITHFCRENSKDYFRFDPFLHLRYDRSPDRNHEILIERLSPEEIAILECSDPQRFRLLEKECDGLAVPAQSDAAGNQLFYCGAGTSNFTVSYDGTFHLCPALWHPDSLYDLKAGNLADAWHHFVPRIRNWRSTAADFQENCRSCPLFNLCMWCPANAHLETGQMDRPVEYFCKTAHARAALLGKF